MILASMAATLVEETRKAIKQFQSEHSSPVNSILDPTTLAILQHEANKDIIP